jgi:hypothetical protein
MPTNRHRRPRMRRANVSVFIDEDRQQSLCDGILLDFIFGHDPAAIAGAWEQHGQEITVRYIQRSPGHRPWAWWRFSAPKELRRRVTTPRWEPDAADRHQFATAADAKMRPGTWYFEKEPPSFGLPLPFYKDSPYFESEADYLARHRLLTPDEKAALAKTKEAATR